MTFKHWLQLSINKFKFNRRAKKVIEQSKEKLDFKDYLQKRITYLEEEIESIYFPSKKEEERGEKLKIRLDEIKRILKAYDRWTEE